MQCGVHCVGMNLGLYVECYFVYQCDEVNVTSVMAVNSLFRVFVDQVV